MHMQTSSGMSIFWIPQPLLLLLIVGLISLVIYALQAHRVKKIAKNEPQLPPGPRGFPLIGALPMMGHFPHLTLHEWAKEYGPVMYVKLGLIPTIVVSNPQAAEQVFKTHDLVFASRPMTEVGRIINYNLRGMTFHPYGQYWRQIRKLCTIELLSNIRVDSFRPIRKEEMGLVVRSLMKAAKAHEAVDLSEMVATLSYNMTCRMVFGKKYLEENEGRGKFKEVNEELIYLAGAFNISEFIPSLRYLDLQGVGRRLKAVFRAFDEFTERVIDDHLKGHQDSEAHEKDFVDHLLSVLDSDVYEFHFDRANIKAIIVEMIVAAIDTTSVTVEWVLAELLRSPKLMRKAQEELERVVGKERWVDESDIVKLDYLNMVIKETLRLHPPAPLLLPHESMQDCILNGYYIPKGSRLIVNAWAIGRDPHAWPNPLEFQPERFVGNNVDFKGHDFQLIPFGAGRRGCPGMQLGLTAVKFVVAQLIHCFDWELPNGMLPSNLDMSEKPGIILAKAEHLLSIPSYRLTLTSFGAH